MFFDVAIIRSNSVSDDTRVSKIVQSLSKRYRIILIGWDRERVCEPYEIANSRVHIKRLRIRAPYGKLSLVFYYPVFWMWILFNLVVYRPEITHACDLDTLLPSYIFKVLFSNKLVFDSFDRYAMAFIHPKHRLIYAFVNLLEEMLASKADVLITVSNERLSTFYRRPRYSEVIMNCPEDEPGLIKSDLSLSFRGGFVPVHAGGIGSGRGLIQLSDAIKDLEGVHIVLAGKIIHKETYEQLLSNPKVEYVGFLPYCEAIKLQASADVIPVFYDPVKPISRVANPNKLFEAMMLGKPVITNVCSEIVNQTGCGLVVEYDSKNIKNAMRRLKNDSSLRREMGAKARMAFEKTFNWDCMEKKLLALYGMMLKTGD